MDRAIELNKIIGENIAKIRKAKGISVLNLCKKVGITNASYASYIKGTRTVPSDVLFKISKELDISMDYLCSTAFSDNRHNAVTFLSFNKENNKERVIISNEDDNLVFYKITDFTYEYYLKTQQVQINKKMLVTFNNETFPAIVYETNEGTNSILNLNTNIAIVLSNRRLNLEVITLGIYAGKIDKEINVPNFL